MHIGDIFTVNVLYMDFGIHINIYARELSIGGMAPSIVDLLPFFLHSPCSEQG